MAYPTVVLITGANRGLGEGLLKLFLARPNHTVIAANRNPDHPTSKAIKSLPKGEDSTLHVVKLDLKAPGDAAQAAKDVAKLGIEHIDVLIANSGIVIDWIGPDIADIDFIREHMEVNFIGNIRVYQAFLPLIKRAKEGKWVTIGSSVGYFTEMPSFPNAGYGPSKAAVHWMTRHFNQQEPGLIAFPIDPGFVQTDMGARGAAKIGVEKATLTTDDSVNGMIKVIDQATRESHGGKMWTWEGKEVPW